MRLLVHVEGETEETFVNEALAPHLYGFGYTSIGARLMGNARLRDRRGGVRAWSAVRGDIERHLREDRSAIATTMVDYYAMPATGTRAWPGRAAASGIQFSARASSIETALRTDIVTFLGPDFDGRRFIPFVVMHEFEGLLFSDTIAFSRGIGQAHLAGQFSAIRNQFTTPEEINDAPLTAPSKRIQALVPHYEKPLLGTLAVLEIGLPTIRRACPHFNRWVGELEGAVS